MRCNRRLALTQRTALTDRQLIERHHRITNNNAIDLYVGKRLRLGRMLLGLSQEQLGAKLNINFQHVVHLGNELDSRCSGELFL